MWPTPQCKPWVRWSTPRADAKLIVTAADCNRQNFYIWVLEWAILSRPMYTARCCLAQLKLLALSCDTTLCCTTANERHSDDNQRSPLHQQHSPRSDIIARPARACVYLLNMHEARHRNAGHFHGAATVNTTDHALIACAHGPDMNT